MNFKLLNALLVILTCVLVFGGKLNPKGKAKNAVNVVNDTDIGLPSNVSLQSIMNYPLGSSYLSMMQRLPGMSGFAGFSRISGQSRTRIKAYVVKRRQLVVRCCGKRSCYGNRNRNNDTNNGGADPDPDPDYYEEKPDPLCKGPACPLLLCIKDPSMFEADMTTLKINAAFGKNITACGKTYVIGKGPRTQEQALAECCRIGMDLLSINNIVELECVKGFLKTNDQLTKIWTSGSDRNCEAKWGWCSTNECLPKIPAPIPWKSGNPDNFGKKEHCATLTTDGTLNDELCDAKYDFVCEDKTPPLSPQFINSTCSEIAKTP